MREVLLRLRPGGTVVMSLVAREYLARAIAVLDAAGVVWDCTQLQAARGRPGTGRHPFAAEHPVWVISAHKPRTQEGFADDRPTSNRQ